MDEKMQGSYEVVQSLHIWDRFRERHIIKIAFCLNRCNFRTVNAIDFLFSKLRNTPFLYVDLYFRVLHELRADVMRPDYP